MIIESSRAQEPIPSGVAKLQLLKEDQVPSMQQVGSQVLR